jgi:hypothetical protein
MDTELIKRLAREAWGADRHHFATDQLMRFVGLVAEECAKAAGAAFDPASELAITENQARSRAVGAIRAMFPKR